MARNALVFREQIFQIGLREILREALFAENVGNGLGFALLEVPDFFFDGAGSDQAVGVHRLGLADTMRAVDRLGFNGRVPPWIVEDDVAGVGQI